jgi:MFS family permease
MSSPADARVNRWAQLALSILIMLNTWLAPLEGLLVDRCGPRPMVMFGGLCAAAAWIMNSHTQSLGGLYAGAVVGIDGLRLQWARPMSWRLPIKSPVPYK